MARYSDEYPSTYAPHCVVNGAPIKDTNTPVEATAARPASAIELQQMGQALSYARQAVEFGDVPVGAVVFDSDNRVLGAGFNTRERDLDISGHAELNALRAAAKNLGDWRLGGCTVVVTLEPCAMCAAAIAATQPAKLIFGAWDQRAGACGSVYDILRDGLLPHPVPEVIAGVCAAECAQLLTDFFVSLRSL